jgi:hypothetical protein
MGKRRNGTRGADNHGFSWEKMNDVGPEAADHPGPFMAKLEA